VRGCGDVQMSHLEHDLFRKPVPAFRDHAFT
jgi:hypothetical protein